MRPQILSGCALLLVLVAATLAFATPQERRVALVIGNGSYKDAPLKNPVNDASDVATALKGLGFDVTLLTDATHHQMDAAVAQFGLKLRQGGLGLFYYAGHGVQVAGENYLVPVDAAIQSESDVKFKCLHAGLVLGKMEDAGNGLNVVIMDACRNNPFARSFRSAERGLAKMDASDGSLIAFATGPGKTAEDGAGKNGTYTKHLLANIRTPGLTISDMFMRVRQGVREETGKRQVPWEVSSLTGHVYLGGQAPGPQAALPQASVVPAAAHPAVAAPAVAVMPPGPAVQAAKKPDRAKRSGLLLKTPADEELLRKFEEAGEDLPRIRALAEPLAAQGSAFGQLMLGMASQDPAERLRLITQSANQGMPRAWTVLGMIALFPESGKADPKAARQWLRKAADLGDVEAKAQLGEMLFEGKGGPKDAKAGERLLLEAAQEDPAHYRTLVSYYWNGVFVPKDEAKGFGLHVKAAEAGLADAVGNLGGFYERGEHVAQNNAEAAKWYRRAVEQGYLFAAYRLGLMYEEGRGVPQSDAEAAKMYWSRTQTPKPRSGWVFSTRMVVAWRRTTPLPPPAIGSPWSCRMPAMASIISPGCTNSAWACPRIMPRPSGCTRPLRIRGWPPPCRLWPGSTTTARVCRRIMARPSSGTARLRSAALRSRSTILASCTTPARLWPRAMPRPISGSPWLRRLAMPWPLPRAMRPPRSSVRRSCPGCRPRPAAGSRPRHRLRLSA